MRGVSAAVMLGQYGYFGTNAFNVVLDLKEMENYILVTGKPILSLRNSRPFSKPSSSKRTTRPKFVSMRARF
jgi:hypothetical protein